MSENMLFCLGDGQYESTGDGYQKNYRIFNREVSKEVFEKANNAPTFELPIAKWIDKKDMTAEEKKLKSYWETTGGYLKTLSYEDAWKEAKMSDEFKNWVKNLPNFNAEIFEKITGLKIENCDCNAETIEVNGKKYKLIN